MGSITLIMAFLTTATYCISLAPGSLPGPLAISPKTSIPIAKPPKPTPRLEPKPPPGTPYWYDPRIHVWGNIGWRGRIHATMAPLATYMIDHLSYAGQDVRKQAHSMIDASESVLDLCCGVGFSTIPGATGVDTSREMLDMARFVRRDADFQFGNAETFGDSESYDVVTVMYACHEMPADARRRVVRNALRVAKKSVIIVDIHPGFERLLREKPMQGASFLAGEPYVLDYLAKMDSDVFSSVPGHMRFGAWGFNGWQPRRITMIDERVVMYRIDRI